MSLKKRSEEKYLDIFKELLASKNKKIKKQLFMLVEKSFFRYALGFPSRIAQKHTMFLFKKLKQTSSINEANDYLRRIVYSKSGAAIRRWVEKRAERDFEIIKKWLIGYYILNIKAGRGHLGLQIKKNSKKKVILADKRDINKILAKSSNAKRRKFDTVLISGELHHIKNQNYLLMQIGKITRRRLIIFESRIFCEENALGLAKNEWTQLNLFSEWLFESLKTGDKSQKPSWIDYKQIDYRNLKKIFNRMGLKLIYEKYIPVGPKEVIIHHHRLFVLDKE